MGKMINLPLVERYYHELWNRFDKSIAPTILHEELSFRGSLGQAKRGLSEFCDYVDFVQAAFPDFHNRIVETIIEGDKTFTRLAYTGTHRGELFGIAPTHKRVEYPGAAVFTVEDGKIAEIWVLGDVYGLMQQLLV